MKKLLLAYSLLLVVSSVFSQLPNTWTQKADFGGIARLDAVGFSIGSKGYIGLGIAADVYKKDFWEYDPDGNTWTQKADFAGDARSRAVGFSIGTKGYVGTGHNFSGTIHYYNDFWQYDPELNHWKKKANFSGTARSNAVGFSIGSKGYLGTGSDGGYKKDFWEYDPDGNAWTQKADFGSNARKWAVGFSIGSKGYLGTGSDGLLTKDFWEYDPNGNVWTQKADLEGTARYSAVGFSIGSKGYLGTGFDGSYKKDFWEYDPDGNAWTQKADFEGTIRYGAVGFSIGSKGYLGTGYDGNYKKDFWEYSPGCPGLNLYADGDGDTYGDVTNGYIALDCIIPSGYVIDSSDCNDTNASIHPGATELINGIDDDCNGIVDDLVCLTPVNLSVVSTSATSAQLTWEAVNGAIQYKIIYRPTGSSEWSSSMSVKSIKKITGLNAVTQYECKVSAVCNKLPLIISNLSEKATFTTDPLRNSDESLHQMSFEIYPNPSEEQTTIHFTLTQSSHVCVKVYDVNGKEMETLVNDELQEGEQSLPVITNHFAKGVYVVRMIFASGTENRKLMVQ